MTLDEFTAALLEGFTLRASQDTAKVGLEVVHACGEHVCDAEATDTLAELAGVAFDHLDGCPEYVHRERPAVLPFVPPF